MSLIQYFLFNYFLASQMGMLLHFGGKIDQILNFCVCVDHYLMLGQII